MGSGPNICPMSQRAETRIFDIVVVLVFVFVVGWLAMHAQSPETSSIPGVTWPAQPEMISTQDNELLEESETLVEGDPLPPSEADLPTVADPAAPTLDGIAPPSESGAWE